MQWPEETNAVAGGDTFWTLITRDCGIILNWFHLKKSRIIFFVIVTYWQSMARFRKNDFFKWAQKIKSVFCFNPHTHEGCDARIWRYDALHDVSIHTPTRVWLCNTTDEVAGFWFQSTHPRRVWQVSWLEQVNFGKFQSTHPRRVWQGRHDHRRGDLQVSIHTPTKGVTNDAWLPCTINLVSIHTPTKGVTMRFQRFFISNIVSIHTPTKGVT